MARILNQEDREIIIKKSAKKIKKSQANLELNYYIQKKVMDYPETYIDEIRKDICELEKVLD